MQVVLDLFAFNLGHCFLFICLDTGLVLLFLIASPLLKAGGVKLVLTGWIHLYPTKPLEFMCQVSG